MQEISYSDQAGKAVEILSKGTFLTAGDSGKCNVMTIGWGNIGFMWGKPVFTVMVRPSRHTHSFMGGGTFTVSLPLAGMKDALALCGSKSGRDIDKIKAAGLKLRAGQKVPTPVIDGCGLYYECRVVYKYDMVPGQLDQALDTQWYKDGDYHTVYIGEILAAYTD
jgi:flavin reductase (DIM6/NTAB) family NADH-FMN oxidoreductase RutF